MAGPNVANQLADQLMKAAEVVEEHIDSEMKKLDTMDEDDLEVIRRRRLEEMKKVQKAKQEMLANGHGAYTEVADEKEFFEATKKSKNVVCVFYLDGNFTCKVVDKHMKILAAKHMGTRFIHVNAEKVPFLTKRLNIRVIPTAAIVKDQQAIDYIRFEDPNVLEARLAGTGIIKVDKIKTEPQRMKIIRGAGSANNENDDW